MNWPKNLIKKIKTNVKLADYTTFKIGGPAKFFFEPKDTKELLEALGYAREKRLPVFILGSGSNILVSDGGVKGLVIRLSADSFKDINKKGSYLVAGSGLKLNQLILFAKTQGLSGLEFLAGIPGTLGGSLMGNAGAWGKSIGELVEQVWVLDYNNRLRLLFRKDLKFSYRQSNLNKYIILWAKLKLRKQKKEVIAARIKQYLIARGNAQNNLPNAGCIFKNPGRLTTGKLIDLCGLKGRIKGGAIISKAHANFILNSGQAKSRDVLGLMNIVRKKVKENFKINLEPEIKIWK